MRPLGWGGGVFEAPVHMRLCTILKLPKVEVHVFVLPPSAALSTQAARAEKAHWKPSPGWQGGRGGRNVLEPHTYSRLLPKPGCWEIGSRQIFLEEVQNKDIVKYRIQ